MQGCGNPKVTIKERLATVPLRKAEVLLLRTCMTGIARAVIGIVNAAMMLRSPKGNARQFCISPLCLRQA